MLYRVHWQRSSGQCYSGYMEAKSPDEAAEKTMKILSGNCVVSSIETGVRVMREYVIQYIDENGEIQVAYVKGYSKEDAARRFAKEGSR